MPSKRKPAAGARPKTPATSPTAPQPPVLGSAPAGDWWTDEQWAVMLSLLDAIVPPIVSADKAVATVAGPNKDKGRVYPDGLVFDRTSFKKLPAKEFDGEVERLQQSLANAPGRDVIEGYLAERASDNPEFLESIKRTLAGVSGTTRADMGKALKMLTGNATTFALTGHYTATQHLPVHVREEILKTWSKGWIADLRKLVRGVYALAQTSFLLSSRRFAEAAGYLEVPPHWRAGPSWEFVFEQFPPEPKPREGREIVTLETDVVVVGSGCGGAVAAQTLAAAGHRVVVVDKGYHFPTTQLPMPQETGGRLLYENGGVVAATDPTVTVLAGSCWGGGGTINWSVCLRPQDAVRREWAAGKSNGRTPEPGMAFVTSPAFDACIDRVCAFMGCADPTTAAPDAGQSHRGRVLLDGSQKLGWDAAPLLQNTTGGRPHDDGYCHLGCCTSEKLGTSTRWLPAAADAGAKLIEGFAVERVLFEGDDGRSGVAPDCRDSDNLRSAVGVVGTWTSRDAAGGVTGPASERHTRRVVVRAKEVIVSGGSLCSPLILKRSGLTNPQIGKNLHLHPCNLVTAIFDEETQPMDHGIITSYCTSFEDMDGHCHGPRLETICMVPYAVLANMPWTDGLDFKRVALQYRHCDGFIALTRDRDAGTVAADPVTGQPVIDYHISPLDREHALEGAIGIARLCYATGAREIRIYAAGTTPFVRKISENKQNEQNEQRNQNKQNDQNDQDDQNKQRFERWITDVRNKGLAITGILGSAWAKTTPFASAHQMGTCRMGDDQGDASVVDPRGRVWGTRGLYVADASVFPSASGVNPMVTTMALADWIAQGIAKELAETKD